MILFDYYGELGFDYNYSYNDAFSDNEIHRCTSSKLVVEVLFYRELYCDDHTYVAQLENKLRVFL